MIAAPGLDEIEALALDALATIPAPLRAHVGNVAIQVEEFPDDEVMRDMELETPFDLLGSTRGCRSTARACSTSATMSTASFSTAGRCSITGARRAEDLRHLIRHVLIHEIGHHFGLSDDDMETLEAQADIEAAARLPEPGAG